MIEKWKVVEGYEGKYEVSNFGEVRNVWDNVPVAKVIAGIPQYWYVNLTHPDKTRALVRLHREVAKAFIPNPENLPMVDHIDRDRLNNKLFNLRWVTRSGNQRNTERNNYFGEGLLLDYVKQYENPEAAYAHIDSSIKSGLTQQEALDKYSKYLEYGRKQFKVEWNGETVYLADLCAKYLVEYDAVRDRLTQGWGIWNAISNINPNNPFSFEVKGKYGVGHWFPSKAYFSNLHSESLLKYLDEGLDYEDVLTKDGKDYLRQTVRGVYGTVKELCEHFEVSLRAVETNRLKKGMTLEEAIFSPRQRVKRLSINGVYNSPKYWYESFGINAKTANKYKSDKKLTFKETFEHYGVDTSEMVISIV
jgi:hypothetical protein